MRLGRFIFWLLDVLTAFILVMIIPAFWTESMGLIESLFITVICAYILAGINMIICVIFNFWHEYDDYDGVGDFFYYLALAPLALVQHLFTHLFKIFKPEYVGTSRKNFTTRPKPDYNPSEDKRKDPTWHSLEDAIRISISHPCCTYYGEFCPAGIRSIEARYEVRRIFSGAINISMKVFVESDNLPSSESRVKDFIADRVDQWSREVHKRVAGEIEKAREKYKGYDREYSVNIHPEISIR